MFCKQSNYWEMNWPSRFFAEVVDIVIPHDGETKSSTCCFQITSKDESRTEMLLPETNNFYEFEEDNPVYNVEKCICDYCS